MDLRLLTGKKEGKIQFKKSNFCPLNNKVNKSENINQVSVGINFYSHSSQVGNDPDYTQFIIQTIKGAMLLGRIQ
jgi:hypothetical protein